MTKLKQIKTPLKNQQEIVIWSICLWFLTTQWEFNWNTELSFQQLYILEQKHFQ